tara:strand:- start:2865 stop:3245 length:381 start_codon:yes stop_codon:yes gene_type:complete
MSTTTTNNNPHISPLVPHIGRREVEFTANEARAMLTPSVSHKAGRMREEKGWKCTDRRTKDAKTRMRKKHAVKFHNTKVNKYIAKIDEHMQNILESQDPTKEVLYDEFAKRRAMWVSKLLTEVQND